MKKAILIILVLLILFLPIPQSPYKDGGTRCYFALTYKIVKWNRLYEAPNDSLSFERYQNTSIYWFPDNFEGIDENWEEREKQKLEESFKSQ